jgi:hypothetical protein
MKSAHPRQKARTRRPRAHPRQNARTRRRPEARPPAEAASESAPEILARSAVYRRLPERVRSRLDRAILTRPKDLPTLEAMAERFELQERFQVSLHALRGYAWRLERLARPAATSRIMAGVLGCLPRKYREQLLAGGEVLLVSRVLQALHGDTDGAENNKPGEAIIPVSDLVKLGAILAKLGTRPGLRASPGARKKSKGHRSTVEEAASASAALNQALKLSYGITWPPRDETAPLPPGGSSTQGDSPNESSAS